MLMNLLARFLARPSVTNWLIERVKKTPYTPVKGIDGTLYMERFWLFNPYPTSVGKRRWWRSLLPSIRIHRILQGDRDLHDHPWNARTFILRGGYREEREAGQIHHYFRTRGTTERIRFGEFHRITKVSPDSVWTLFITWRKQGTWHFMVNGKKIPWREYQNAEGANKGESK